MKVLLTGGSGQLGRELRCSVPAHVELLAPSRAELDIAHAGNVATLTRRLAPDLIINAAAYTQVDAAESDADTAFAVNAAGAEHLALAARDLGIPLVQLSTDFVFDGRAKTPYLTCAAGNPLNVYGASKWEGEQRVRRVLGEQALILRTAWVYSAHGNNFVTTMLRLMRQREEIGVVADQIGSPTCAGGLAQVVWRAVERELRSTLHWTDAGVASWYDFAVATQEEAMALGLLEKTVSVRPIRSEDYPTPARRPAYSVLDKTESYAALGLEPTHWRAALRQMLRGKSHLAFPPLTPI